MDEIQKRVKQMQQEDAEKKAYLANKYSADDYYEREADKLLPNIQLDSRFL